MWKHIKKRLGKLVQELKQIFRRRENNTPAQNINKELEFSFSTHRTNLPKPIEFPCANIVISSHFSKEYEAIIFDMSHYEKKKIAHIISYTPERIEEYFKGKEELTLEEVENQCMVALIPGGKVLYDEENDEWDYCFD